VDTSEAGLKAPKADMCGATRDVCYGPIADIASDMKEAATEGGLIEVHYSPFRNIAYRAFPSALINIWTH
jgi:hypothetical protein